MERPYFGGNNYLYSLRQGLIMEVKDLMIGSLLEDSLTGELLEVCDLSEGSVVSKVIDRSKFPLPKGWQAQYIPLTEEWLIRLGFRKSSGPNPHFSYGMTMLIFRTEYEAEELENYYHFRFGIADKFRAERQVRLDYVHQLQRLTWILEGKELII